MAGNGGSAANWDSKGNLTSDPTTAKTYGYSSENLLTSATGGVTLGYDPALRLYQTVSGATTTRFLYDGADAIAEYNGSNALQRRFVFDPTTGQPVLWYEGTGTASTNRRYLSLDERGSVISVSDSTAASLGINKYDEYGKPGAANIGRFQYTGQKWIGEAGLYDYKARDYLPHLGIFAQTDPIGYAGDGPNLYAYVLNDPVNFTDPFGLSGCDGTDPSADCEPIYVVGARLPDRGCGPGCTRGDTAVIVGGGNGSGNGEAGGGDKSKPQQGQQKTRLEKFCPNANNINWNNVGNRTIQGFGVGTVRGINKVVNRWGFYALSAAAAGSVEPGGGTVAGALAGVVGGIAKDVVGGAIGGALSGAVIGIAQECKGGK